MTKSKMLVQLCKATVMLFFLSTVVSCVKAQKQTGGPATDSRRVFNFSRSGTTVDLTGYAADQIASQNIQAQRVAFTGVISDQANYGNRREYNLSMCGLSDVRMSSATLMGQKFEIASELEVYAKPDGGKIATVQNDNCLYWTVMIPFDPVAGSVNLYVNFIFKTIGGAKTFIHRTVLFNPWDQQRGSNPEFFDFTRFGLSPQMSELPMAVGQDEIYQALSGDGKFSNTNRKLEIGSVQFVPVRKNIKNGEYTLPASSEAARDIKNIDTAFIHGSNIGDQTDAAFKSIYDIRQSALSEGQPGTDIQQLRTLDMHLNIRLANLQVRLKDSAGVNHDMPLPTGQYKIEAQVIASDSAQSVEDQGQYHIISSRVPYNSCDEANCNSNYQSSNATVWNTQTMGVNAVLPLSLVARPMWGNIQLLLRVTPVKGLKLEPFEAVYYLGTFDSIGQGSSPIFDLAHYFKSAAGDISFSYDEYLKKATNYREWLAGTPEKGIDLPTIEHGFRQFRFTHLDVLFSRIVPGDTATDRTVQYTVKTCLQATSFGVRPQAGLRFDIETEDRGIKTKIPHTTDDQGCLSWVGLISHKFYQREKLIPKESVLTYVDGSRSSESQTLRYYINPWDEKFTFGRDERVLPQYYIQQINDGQKFAPPTRLLITDFKYDAIGFRYVVDKYMNLTVKKTVLLDLKPKLLKYNSIIWGRSGFGDLRDGIYLLKVAMQKDYLDPAAPGRRIEVDARGKYTIPYNQQDTKTRRVFITIKEVLVRVLGGHIVTPIEFDINDLRTLRLRSQMFVQLETIDEMLLRAVMMMDNRLTQQMNTSTQLTLDIRNRQLTDDQMALEIDRLMKEAASAANAIEIQAKIRDLQSRRSENYAQLRQLLSGVDPTVAQQLFSDIERIGRDGGQTAESVQGNLRYQALNRYIEIMNKVVREYQKQSTQPDFVRTREIQESFAQERSRECAATAQRLNQRGETDLAQRYSPDHSQTLCPLTIPADQMFYFLSSRSDLGSERWLSEVLTADEITILKNSLFPGHSGNISSEIINVMRDDFTEAYRPDYDFNLLSNQGDEMTPGVDIHTISGLSRRTFMGPVTFVLNGNGSAMRPTDVLDEASCGRTCEQLAEIELDQVVASETVQSTIDVVRNFGSDVNEAYEKNPYFGYVGQFYKKQVNDLIPMYRGVNRIYREEMEAFSKDGYFVDSLMLDHVRLTNPDTESLKTLDVNCYLDWKDGIEKLYEQWRDLSETTTVNINVTPIPQSCFKQTSRTVAPQNFLDKVNAVVPLMTNAAGAVLRNQRVAMQNDVNYFIRPTNTYAYSETPVTLAEMKEFSKNGVRSVRLSLAKKENILHHMCYLTRETVAPQGAMVRQIMTDALNPNARPRSGSKGPAFAAFLRTRLDRMEDKCHEYVDSYVNTIKAAGKMTPKNQAILMSSLTKHLPFNLERRVRVLDTTNRYMYQDGKTLNYSVSKSFGIDGGFRTGRGRKLEFDADKIVAGFTSPLGAMATGAAAGAAIGAFTGPGALLTAGVGALVGLGTSVIGSATGMMGFNFEWTEGDGMSTSNGTGVSSGTTLAAQISTLDIELARFEKCMVVRPSTQFLVETRKDIDEENDWVDSDTTDGFGSYRFVLDFKKIGYFVCSGDIQTEDDLHVGNSLRVREKYYYFTQIFNDGDMQDPGELVNHPWMLMLRGQRDFAVFEQALMIPEQQLTWGEARDQQINDVLDFVGADPGSNNRVSGATLHGMPSFNAPGDFEVVRPDDISKALDMMQEGFERALPAVPGMFTFSDYETDGVSGWPQGPTTPAQRTAPRLTPRGGR